MVQTLLFLSLVLILILLIVQTLVLRKRNRQVESLLEQLKEQDREATLGRLLTGVAHDLNTPLGALSCAMHTRRQALTKLKGIIETDEGSSGHELGTGKALKALDDTEGVVSESLKRTMDMIEILRKAGRGEPEDPIILPANEILKNVLRILDHRFKSGITVQNELDPNLFVKVLPGDLGRVFANLLVNAYDALEGKGIIRITSVVNDGLASIEVADNGPGLPSGEGKNLFCSGWTTKECGHGSGLGLFISREIMTSFGGSLQPGSSDLGGASMILSLPVAQAPVVDSH